MPSMCALSTSVFFSIKKDCCLQLVFTTSSTYASNCYELPSQWYAITDKNISSRKKKLCFLTQCPWSGLKPERLNSGAAKVSTAVCQVRVTSEAFMPFMHQESPGLQLCGRLISDKETYCYFQLKFLLKASSHHSAKSA